MTNNLFFSEILFTIIVMIGLMVFWQLYKSKDGTLRKIMITYFLVEVFIYTASGIYFWKVENGTTDLSIDMFRLMILTPKAAVKLWLFFWLSKNNSKQ
jgi:glycerol uptake facilitator-like aquaporin